MGLIIGNRRSVTPKDADETSSGLMSSDDKVKIDNIEEKAQVNIIEKVKLDTTLLAIDDKTVAIPIADSSKNGAMSKDQAKDLADSKNTNSVQDTVVAEALAKLNKEFEAFKKMLQSGNIGDIHVTSVNSDSVPMYCGQSMILNGSGSPISNAVVPDFVGQIYVDTTNRNAYMCCDSSSASYWKLLN